MAMIKREAYLNQLIEWIGTSSIKLITGIKGAGKSAVLSDFRKYITQEIPDAHIIYVSFEFLKYEKLKTWEALRDYIENEYQEGKHNFVFVDDIQLCPRFEKAINDLYATNKYDLFIAAPNAFGKYFRMNKKDKFVDDVKMIEIFPASLKEFMQYYQLDEVQTAYERYLEEGGMLGSYAFPSMKAKYALSLNILDDIIGVEVLPTYSVYLSENAYQLCDYLRTNIGGLFTAKQIEKEAATIQKNKKTTGALFIYTKYMFEALLFHRVGRYNIDASRPVMTKFFYAWTDHSFYCAKVKKEDWNRLKLNENVMIMELFRRGYHPYIGYKTSKQGTDRLGIVAVKGEQKCYIDILENLDDQEQVQSLIQKYNELKDDFPKVIVTLEKCSSYKVDKVKVVNFAEWLVADEDEL